MRVHGSRQDRCPRGALALGALLLCAAARAAAHAGPPYPILVDRAVGPCLLSVWADPDVGIGTFFVILEPPPGGTVPEDARVEVRVQPVSGRLPEAAHPARREPIRRRVQYRAEVPFDAEEQWRVRVLLDSARGGGEAVTEVDVTPPGLGAFDLVLYLLPFVAVGILWLRAALRQRGTPTTRRGRDGSEVRVQGAGHRG